MNSDKEQEIYNKAKDLFLYGDRHPKMIQFRQKMRKDFAIYDNDGEWCYNGVSGNGQWRIDDLDALSVRGQLPLTVNVVKRTINSFVSAEISSRSRIGFRPQFIHSPTSTRVAELLTRAGLFFQESLSVQRDFSLSLRDGAVCGLGWCSIFAGSDEGAALSIERVDPWYIIPDMDDTTSDFKKMRFVARKYFVPIDIAMQTWKNFKKNFSSSQHSQYPSQGTQSKVYWDKAASYVTNLDAGIGNDRNVLVIEIQYKERKKCYRGVTKAGNPYSTFDSEEADKVFDSKEEIDESPADQIMRTVFCNNILLEHAPLQPMIPNLEDFSYIPFVFSRCVNSSIPDGFVALVESTQLNINARHVKMNYALNSPHYVVTGDMAQEEFEALQENASKLDGFKYFANADVKPLTNGMDIGKAQFDILQLAYSDIEKETNWHPEAMGETSGANQSGVAISKLQSASMRGQNFVYDGYILFKKRVGRVMASILQRMEDLPVFSTTSDEETSGVAEFLNSQEIDRNGKRYVGNDVRGLPLAVYVEEMPDNESTFAETRKDIDELLMHPQAELLLQNQPLLEARGTRNAQQIVEATMSAVRQKAMAEQAGKADASSITQETQ